MGFDDYGNNITFEDKPETIDFYIKEFARLNDTLTSLLRRDPETREAIINASYKDVLRLRAKAFEVYRNTQRLFDNGVLHADSLEVAAAANEHPLSFENEK